MGKENEDVEKEPLGKRWARDEVTYGLDLGPLFRSEDDVRRPGALGGVGVLLLAGLLVGSLGLLHGDLLLLIGLLDLLSSGTLRVEPGWGLGVPLGSGAHRVYG